MNTPLPKDVKDLPPHQGFPFSDEERSRLPALDWQEQSPPVLPPKYGVVFDQGAQWAADGPDAWHIGPQRNRQPVDIRFPLPRLNAELWLKLGEERAKTVPGSLEWFNVHLQCSSQELGRAGNQKWAMIAIEALRKQGLSDDLQDRLRAQGYEYRHTIKNWCGMPLQIYHKSLGTHFLQLSLSPVSATLEVEKDGSGMSDLLVSFYTNEQDSEGGWIPRRWPGVVADPAVSIAFAALAVSVAFEEEWSGERA